jgi:hypothetical protein
MLFVLISIVLAVGLLYVTILLQIAKATRDYWKRRYEIEAEHSRDVVTIYEEHIQKINKIVEEKANTKEEV